MKSELQELRDKIYAIVDDAGEKGLIDSGFLMIANKTEYSYFRFGCDATQLALIRALEDNIQKEMAQSDAK